MIQRRAKFGKENLFARTRPKSMGFCSREANSAIHGQIVPNFEFIRNIMVFLHTSKNEEDPIKNEGARVLTRLYVIFSDAQGQVTQQSAM